MAKFMTTTAAFLCLILFICAPANAGSGDDYWPSWRGPAFTGMAVKGDPPTEWSETKNIKWKIELPGDSLSTPVVWENKIIIQTAVPAADVDPKTKAAAKLHSFDVLCLDRANGKVIWRTTTCVKQPHEGHHRGNGYASYSPVTDGEHIWVSWGSRGLYCLDMNGVVKWQKDMPQMKTRATFGEGSSPAIAGDKLIVLADQEGDSAIFAFNKTSGELAWRKERDEQTSWTTPLVVPFNGKLQVIVPAAKFTRSYDAANGDVIWKCSGQTQNAIPVPIPGVGRVYCMSGFRGKALQAIALDRTGDLTGTDAVAWLVDKDTSYVPSAVLSNGKLFFCAGNGGQLSCVDAATGEIHYSNERLPEIKKVYASLIGAKDRIYVAGREGVVAVVKSSSKFEVISSNKLEDSFDASPIIVGDDLYLKGRKNLYCVAETKAGR